MFLLFNFGLCISDKTHLNSTHIMSGFQNCLCFSLSLREGYQNKKYKSIVFDYTPPTPPLNINYGLFILNFF